MEGRDVIAGDPDAIERAARRLRAAGDGLADAAESVRRHGQQVTAEWTGEASDAARDRIEFLGGRTRVGADVSWDAAVVFETYAAELRAAQQAYAVAEAAHAAATAEQARVRQSLEQLPPGARRDPDYDVLLRQAGAPVTAAAQDMAAAVERERVANGVAGDQLDALTAELADMTATPPAPPPPPPPPPPKDDGGWLFGEFVDGVRDGVTEPVGFVGGLAGLNGDFTDNWADFGNGVKHGVTNPTDLARAAINWEDLSQGNYAHWAGEFVPSVAAAFATGGAAAGAKGADALSDVARSGKALDEMSEAEKAALLTRGGEMAPGSVGRPGEGVPPSSQRVFDYSGRFEDELKNFRSVRSAGPVILDEDLWLVNVHDRSRPVDQGRSMAWAAPLDEVLRHSRRSYLQRLALLPAWGPRDGMSIIRIPAGTEVDMTRGSARYQVDLRELSLVGRTAHVPVGLKVGGGDQILFRQFDSSWVVHTGDAPWPMHRGLPGGGLTGAAAGFAAVHGPGVVQDVEGREP